MGIQRGECRQSLQYKNLLGSISILLGRRTIWFLAVLPFRSVLRVPCYLVPQNVRYPSRPKAYRKRAESDSRAWAFDY